MAKTANVRIATANVRNAFANVRILRDNSLPKQRPTQHRNVRIKRDTCLLRGWPRLHRNVRIKRDTCSTEKCQGHLGNLHGAQKRGIEKKKTRIIVKTGKGESDGHYQRRDIQHMKAQYGNGVGIYSQKGDRVSF